MSTITREELKEKLDRGADFKLVNCLDDWMFRAKRITGSIHFERLKHALDTLDPKGGGHFLLLELRPRASILGDTFSRHYCFVFLHGISTATEDSTDYRPRIQREGYIAGR